MENHIKSISVPEIELITEEKIKKNKIYSAQLISEHGFDASLAIKYEDGKEISFRGREEIVKFIETL